MKKLLLIAIVVSACYFQFNGEIPIWVGQESATEGDQVLAAAFDGKRSGLQVEGRGDVVRLLSDDVDGGRHQRFIIRLASGQTLLVAHNIDIALRVADIEEGDRIQFNGQYEWNSEGGVLHWTHNDPSGRHPGGWLKHGGRTYQ